LIAPYVYHALFQRYGDLFAENCNFSLIKHYVYVVNPFEFLDKTYLAKKSPGAIPIHQLIFFILAGLT